MVAAQVIGNDAAIAFAGAQGNFDLLVMLPVMARNLLESITLVGNVSRVLAERCVDGVVANVERCRQLAESSPSIVTPLNRIIGYEAAAKIAKHSVKHHQTIAEAVADLGYLERGEITAEQLATALDVAAMTGPRG
jgi:fumarate hydratase class II